MKPLKIISYIIFILIIQNLIFSSVSAGENSQSLSKDKLTIPLKSVFTSLDEKKCKTLSLNEDEGYGEQLCDGYNGYKLKILFGDDRESLTVVSPNGVEYPLNFTEMISSGFSSLGKTAEWRIETKGKTRTIKSLIVRYNVNESAEHPEKQTSYLIVLKITPKSACIVGKIQPSKTMNIEARAMADRSENMTCLK